MNAIETLNVGLPFEMYKPFGEHLRKTLTRFTVSGETVIGIDLNIYCQAAAAAFAATIEQGISNGHSLMIDVGGNTVIVIASKHGIPTSLGYHQFGRLGMLAAAEQLASCLSGGLRPKPRLFPYLYKTVCYSRQM